MNSIPNTMRAIEIIKPGSPEVLVPTHRPMPELKHDEVLIKVAAAGINRPDCLQRQGLYPPPPGASDIPGLEVAGTVVALGSAVTEWQVGDLLCALVTGGGYAQFCTAPATNCLPVPKGLTLVEAAALPETFFTVWNNVFQRAQLKEGERFLVHGGSSGIGTVAIQLAQVFGARVFASAGSLTKCRACEKLGAERAINYHIEDFVEAVKALTDDEGVDVILDMVGGDYLPRNLEALAVDGRLAQIAFLNGSKVEHMDFMPILLKRLTIIGSTLRARSVARKAMIAQELRERVWPLLEQRSIRPVIDSSYPLVDAAEAHSRMESSLHIGKIMLEV